MGCISLFLLMPYLEELILETADDEMVSVVEAFFSIACQMMPKLKVFSSDGFINQLNEVAPIVTSHYNVDFREIHRPCALEECIVSYTSLSGL